MAKSSTRRSKTTLDAVLVIGSEHEPDVAKLEEDLPDERVFFEPDPVSRLTEDGIATHLRRKSTRHVVARSWTEHRIRDALEAP